MSDPLPPGPDQPAMPPRAADVPPWGPPPRPPYAPPPPRPPARGSSLLGCLFTISVLVNIAAGMLLVFVCMGYSALSGGLPSETGSLQLTEKHHSGITSGNKVAIISLDGVIMEGMLNYVHKEIDQAARDKTVKAVVLRINSPGGSITASDDLHRRLVELRDGNPSKKHAAKPLAVSMGGMAASGGYYIAMPAKPLLAEKTTMTGSIGVYAALLNVHELTDKHGIKMNVIKAGNIKDSGSSFKVLKPEERQVWQDMINTAYGRFIEVVETGRPDLKGKMLERFTVKPVVVDPLEPNGKPYERYRADGGIFTAPLALEKNLIDKIGTLEDAVVEARKLGGLEDNAKAIQYEKPKTLTDLLLGARVLSPDRLKNALMPRLWYLAPGYDAAGLLAAVEAD